MSPLLAVLAASVVVHVPADVRDLSRREASRISGDALSFSEYANGSVSRRPGEPVVVLKDEAPADLRAEGAVAAADLERAVVFVFVRDLERAFGLDRGHPTFRIVLGRVLAHELEHLRRGLERRGHDETGWFRACPTRDEFLAPAFGPTAEAR